MIFLLYVQYKRFISNWKRQLLKYYNYDATIEIFFHLMGNSYENGNDSKNVRLFYLTGEVYMQRNDRA